ncbi:MAG: prepilin peptidase [Lachnospiraceae bacterium]|nr:prepilin peptidase [Lachnospiraceae bacterium]
MCLTVIIDFWKHKIPNYLVIILLIINLLSVNIDSRITSEGMLLRIGKLMLILIFLFPFFSVGALGAGDIKLIIVAAISIGEPLIYFLTIWIVALLIGVTKLLLRKKVKNRIKHLFLYFRNLFLSGIITPYLEEQDLQNIEKRVKYSVHLSLPILASVSINLFLFN